MIINCIYILQIYQKSSRCMLCSNRFLQAGCSS